MKGSLSRRLLAILVSLALLASMPLAAAEPTVTIEPYTKDEFPGWLQDLRRAEIVSLGSLPFVTMGVTLGYSLYRYFSHGMDSDYFPNPFAKSSSAARLTTDEQLGILFTSLGLAAVVGITDFTISSIQRNQQKRVEAELDRGSVEIVPLGDSVESIVSLSGKFPLHQESMISLTTMNDEPRVFPQLEEVTMKEMQHIALVHSRYKEFFLFGLYVTMPQINGVLPHA